MKAAPVHLVTPVPSDEEAAAIVAALELVWPRPVVMTGPSRPKPAGAWRWSGRWWADRPGPAARRRP